MNKSKDTNTKSRVNNDTAYKWGSDRDELTPNERKELELMIALENT